MSDAELVSRKDRTLKSKIAVVALAAAGLSLVGGGAAFAVGGGYGPSVPTGPSNTPGGFDSVVTTQTVGATGGTVSGTVAGASVNVSVPSGAFAAPVQVEVTKPDLTAVTPTSLSAVGFSGYTAVAGLGVKVLDGSGNPVSGTFGKSLDVTLTGAGLGVAGQQVLMLQGASSASVVSSTLGNGSITIHLTQDPNLVVVNAPSTGAATVPGATSKPTGKAYTGEALAAGALVIAGVGLVAFSRRRKSARA